MNPTKRRLASVAGAVLSALAFSVGAAAEAPPSGIGAVCIAPVPVPGYAVQLDDGPLLPTSMTDSIGVGGLAAGGKHRVQVSSKGNPKASLPLDFARFKSRYLCLGFDPLRERWALREMKKSAALCRCQGGRPAAEGLAAWPDTRPLYEKGADVYAQGRLEEAAALFKEVLAIAPEDKHAARALGMVTEELGRGGT